MRNQLVDILKSDLPNYSVYQRNLIGIPDPYSYNLESGMSNHIIINQQDFNINEDYRQFTKKVSQNQNYTPVIEQENRPITYIQQDIPNFDIEYKGTRSLFSNKYKKYQDPMQKELDLLKQSDVQILRQQVTQSQHNLGTALSFSTDRPFSSSLQQSRQLSEQRTLLPSYLNSKQISVRNNYNQSTDFKSSYEGYSNKQNRQLNNDRLEKQYKYTNQNDNQVYKSMVFESRYNVQPNYSRFLLESGERKVFTSEKKSPYTSQLMFNQYSQQENINEATNVKNPLNLQTPYFQKLNTTQITDKPQIFTKQVNTFY
ncbi:hypothetical protein TTHERM_00494170 (macronuclear) [Tetrahymena thermophila SB210]|uniref:Uncharacterized protein n=1 Tax=Tetrahymena thermophila (strain SB210) TaxID=312017 RepID=I7LWW1_TETTS|nr:hypothetical protein TTHERM_00494170 [Tetrahymena thermophila SB210]EAS02965.1 hypothetical protein TTHERM_00494170 [Tetrahymena thermophila SB210]|eukprot:XP_001023210.1 hypothetical protein TTHERM_00494170 [Tetrahymena thermophila SB210]